MAPSGRIDAIAVRNKLSPAARAPSVFLLTVDVVFRNPVSAAERISNAANFPMFAGFGPPGVVQANHTA